MRSRICAFALIGILLAGSPSGAATLVDTGPGPSNIGGALVYRVSATDFQRVGGLFDVTENATVQSVEFWMRRIANAPQFGGGTTFTVRLPVAA